MEIRTGMDDTKSKTEGYVEQMMDHSADSIIENLSFLKAATDRINIELKRGVGSACLDGDTFYYEPSYILQKSIEDSNYPVRILLHSLCHAVFVHSFNQGRANAEIWDLACDIAVENLIIDTGIRDFSLALDEKIMQYRRDIKRYSANMTADSIYRYLLSNPLSPDTMQEYKKVFERDIHKYTRSTGNLETEETLWRRISDKIKVELKLFSKNSGRADSFIGNLEEAAKPKYDYGKLLGRFCQDNESIMVSDDEFDYIYYNFGMTTYDGMPFIEPLELTKERTERDYVVVLDTSSLCRPDIIKGFLKTTYAIIKNIDRYKETINFHIIRHDNGSLSDTVMRGKADLDLYLENLKAPDFGGADFRPVFEYVDNLIRNRAFTDFRGLIYFTDGFGIFPGKDPGFECIVAMIPGNFSLPEVPWWATPIILDEESLQI